MKQLFTLALLGIFLPAFSQDYTLRFKSGNYLPNEGVVNNGHLTATPATGVYCFAVQFYAVPTGEQVSKLQTAGIALHRYLPNYAYLATAAVSPDLLDLPGLGIRSVFDLKFLQKMDSRLLGHAGMPVWARQGDAVKLLVHFYPGLNPATVAAELDKKGTVLGMAARYGRVEMLVKLSNLTAVGSLPFVHWVEPVRPPLAENNEPGKSLHRSAFIGSALGRGLDGSGVNVGEWDGGWVETHKDFDSRKTILDSNVASSHATHVAGTILGNGTIDPYATGMAPAATLYSSDYYDDITFEMDTAYQQYGIDITSNSWGYSPSFDTCPKGTYDAFSQEFDNLVYKYPDLVHVMAAANSQTACGNGGYYTISSGANTCKNVITVGAVNYKGEMSSFSSWGPVRDGRLKPEVCGVGVNVYSTQAGSTYAGGWNGTSMATPGVSGTIAQLYQRYRQLHATDPDAALIRAVVCNTADDAGNAHADYKHGFGLLNGLRAVEALENNYFTSDTLSQGNMKSYSFTVPAGLAEMRGLVAWTDKPGDPAMSRALVNDLDIYLITPASDTIRPWTLDPANPANAAVRGWDTVNNIEQITLDTPAAGNYTLVVNGTLVPFGPQKYWFTWLQQKPTLMMEYPNGGETFHPGETRTVRWFSEGINQSHTLEYSSDGGSTWTTTGTAAAGIRYMDWTVPGTPTGQAMLRVISGNDTDVCDNVFNIMHQVKSLNATACNGSVWLNWTAVGVADYYKVYRLSGSTWTPLDSVTTNSYLDTGLANGTIQYYTVRAFTSGGLMGERAFAANATPAAGTSGVLSMDKNTALYCGDSVMLTATGGTAWLWNTGETTASVYKGVPGNYFVTITYTAGCEITSNTVKVTSAFTSTMLPDTACKGSVLNLVAYSEQTATARFTEITQNKTSTGATPSYPSWVSGTNVNGDYVEVTNLGTDTMDISGYRFEQWYADTVLQSFTWPANEMLAPGELSVLHLGNTGVDSAVYHFYNTGAADNLSGSGDARGYVIRNADGRVVDAVTTNGYNLPAHSQVIATDWFGPVPSISGRAGMILTNGDVNLGKNWNMSTVAVPQTIGSNNPGLATIQAATITWTSTGGMNAEANQLSSDSLTETTTLTATLAAGACNSMFTYTITVPSAGSVTVSSDSVCMGDSVMLTRNGGAGPQEWQVWDNMNNTWMNLGTSADSFWISPAMDVMFRNYNYSSTCADSSNEVSVTVSPLAVAGTLSAGATTLCSGSGTSLMISGHTGSNNWQYYDGAAWQSTGMTGDTISVSPTASTLYRVETSTACGSEISDTITLNVNPSPAGGTVSPGSTTICVGSDAVIHLNGWANGTIDWETFDGSNWVSLATSADSLVQQPTGTSIYRAAVSNLNCGTAYSDTASVSVAPMPTVGFLTAGDDSICENELVGVKLDNHNNGNLDWEWFDGTAWQSLAMNSDSINVSPDVSTYLRAVVMGGVCGNVYSDSVWVEVLPVPAAGNVSPASSAICNGESLTLKLNNYANGNIDWEMYDGTTWNSLSVSADSILVTPAADAWLRAVLSNQFCGNATSDTASIAVHAIPTSGTLSAANDSICMGSAGEISISGQSEVDAFLWKQVSGPPYFTTDSTNDSLSIQPSAEGTYTFTCQQDAGACGLVFSDTLSIEVLPQPVGGNISPLTSNVCSGSGITLKLNNHANGTPDWEMYDAANNVWVSQAVTTDSLVVTVSADAWYRVVVTSAMCGSAVSDTAAITTLPQPVGGTLNPASATLCPGDSVLMMATGYTGTLGWEYYDSTTSAWTALAATTDSFYLAPGMSVLVRASATTSCGTAYANTSLIEIAQPQSAGNITPGSSTACAGSLSVLTLTNYGSSGSIGWQQYDATSGTWTNTGTGADTVQVTPQSTTMYRAAFTDACFTTLSDTATVNVTPLPTGGTVTASAHMVCIGSSVQMIAAGYANGSIEWQKYDTTSGLWVNTGITTDTLNLNPTGKEWYRVLVTSASCGNAVSTVDSVNAIALPVSGSVSSSADTTCTAVSVQLTLSGYAGTINWEMYDSTTSTWTDLNQHNAVLNISLSSASTLRAAVSNGYCSVQSSGKTIFTNPSPTKGTAAASADSICLGDTLNLGQFNHNGNVEWFADFGNGKVSIGSGAQVSYVPAQSGVYWSTISLGTCGPDSTNAVAVVVKALPVAGTISAGSGTICSGSSDQLSSNGHSGTVMWEYYDSVFSAWTFISVGTASINVSPMVSTWYRSVVTNNNCGSATSNMVMVDVKPMPAAGSLSASADSLCSGSVYVLKSAGHSGSITWQHYDSTAAGFVTTGTGDSISVSPGQNTTYRTAVMLGGCGPVYSGTHTIHVRPTPAAGTLVATPGSVCIGSQVQLSLSGNGSGTIAWQEFDPASGNWNNISSGASPKNVFPYDTTRYRVRLRSQGCDGYSNEVTVTTLPSPLANITASGPTTVCSGESVTFNTPAGTGYTFQWQRDSVNITGATSRNYDATLAGSYRVIVSGGNGCISTSGSITLTVNAAPATPVITRTGNQLSTSVTGVNYQWYVGGIPIAGATTQTITATQNGSYTVKVTNPGGCSKLSAPLSFIGLPGESSFTDIQVYPNPGTGVYQLSLTLHQPEAVTVKVHDMAGKMVYSEKLAASALHNTQLDLTPLANGVYLLQLSTGQGASVIRIVKQ